MFGKAFLVVMAIALLLATLASPAMAVSPKASGAAPVQTLAWSVPGYSLPTFLPGHIQPNGDCETGGNCSL